jgi:hypothetical protein
LKQVLCRIFPPTFNLPRMKTDFPHCLHGSDSLPIMGFFICSLAVSVKSELVLELEMDPEGRVLALIGGLEVLGQVGEDREPVQQLTLHHVLGVQQGGDAQVLLSHTEGQRIIAKDIILIKTIKVNELRTVMMNDGTEGQPTPPAGGHVHDVNIAICLRHSPAPALRGLRTAQSQSGH